MRYLEITVPADRREAVLDVLDDEGTEYVVTEEATSDAIDDAAVVRLPLPTRAVEPILDRLADAGLEDATSRVVVIDAQTVVSREFDELLDRYSHGGTRGERTSRQVLRTKADEFTPGITVYLVMLLISAVVATAGLLADSPAVVVGSMVIAPLLGPALAASVGIVTGDDELQATGFRYQALGVAVVILASIGIATLARLAGLEPGGVDIVVVAELEERVSPNLLSVAVALGAGIAGILSLTRGFSEAIVGVMIAAALIPPAAAVGITTAWGMYGAALGAFVLVVVNVLSINLAALVTLWVAGYRPQGLFEVSPTRRQTVTYVAVFGIALLVLAAPLAGITLLEFQTTQLKSSADESVEAVLEEPEYDHLEEESVEVVLDDDYPIRSIDRVVVTVRGAAFESGLELESDPDADPPEPALADRLHDRVTAEITDPVVVELRYVVSDERGERADDELLVVRTAGGSR
ncbi:TIGR00341 family protein [Halobiforma nitratireducens]|uniref:TIGR00341 family protein n=1 Tax=Halobiforma nitratireducens JCM 10879 TaxID=1227454 RepID=M0LYB3_9EURY|nr:TIGR00341 family protein [Halobiforma nitratireducens]EMA37349.1 hypothetical protein C446_10860 [Halobiforma nitratireducens JCM 10879]